MTKAHFAHHYRAAQRPPVFFAEETIAPVRAINAVASVTRVVALIGLAFMVGLLLVLHFV